MPVSMTLTYFRGNSDVKTNVKVKVVVFFAISSHPTWFKLCMVLSSGLHTLTTFCSQNQFITRAFTYPGLILHTLVDSAKTVMVVFSLVVFERSLKLSVMVASFDLYKCLCVSTGLSDIDSLS